MGDHQDGPALHQHLQSLLHLMLRFGIQGRGCFIQQQDGGILQQCPGNGNSLTLPSGQPGASLAGQSPVSLRQTFDEIMNVRRLCRRNNLLLRRILFPIGNILINASGIQIGILGYPGNVAPQGFQIPVPCSAAKHPDISRTGSIEPRNQFQHRTLSAAAGACQGNCLRRCNFKVQILQYHPVFFPAPAAIGKGNVFKADRRSPDITVHRKAMSAFPFRRLIPDLNNPRRGSGSRTIGGNRRRKLGHGV